ncbi:hypothetical protein GPN2_22189 [Streptomyces murinus]
MALAGSDLDMVFRQREPGLRGPK